MISCLTTLLSRLLRDEELIGGKLFAPTDATTAAVLSRADRALYRAKHHGRNRVEIEEPG